MEGDFVKIRKSSSFPLENKAQIDWDSHFAFLSWSREKVKEMGGPGSMESIHFGAERGLLAPSGGLLAPTLGPWPRQSPFYEK